MNSPPAAGGSWEAGFPLFCPTLYIPVGRNSRESGPKTGAQQAGRGRKEGGSVKTQKRWELSRDIAALLSSGLCSYRGGEGENGKEGRMGGRTVKPISFCRVNMKYGRRGREGGRRASPLHIGDGERRRKVSTALCRLTKRSSDQVQEADLAQHLLQTTSSNYHLFHQKKSGIS